MPVVAAGALLACVVLTGCGAVAGLKPAGGPECGWMSDGSVQAPDAPHAVVLIDRSDSTRGSGGGRVPDYPADLAGTFADLATTGTTVSIGMFDGSASTVELGPQRITRKYQDQAFQKPEVPAIGRCLEGFASEAAASAPRSPGTDIVGAVRLAAERLGPGGDRTIVVATDGLATVGCADVTGVSIGGPGVREQIADRCRTSDGWGTGLAGIDLSFIDVGHPAADRPQPSTAQLFWLRDLWSELCHDAGATGCRVGVDAGPAIDGGARTVDQRTADPTIKFPPPDQGVQQADGSTAFPVDSAVLFDPNSDRIRDEGAALLDRIGAQIAGMGPVTVQVDGYTEAQSTPQDNLDLATRRAGAVSAALGARGVRATASGSAGTAPGCPAPTDDNAGEARQCTRRVDIIARPSA